MQLHTLRSALFTLAFTLTTTSLGACLDEVDVETDTEAIVNGDYDPTSRTNDAVVRLSTGCTAGLITADILLTAGHCIPGSGRAVPPPGASVGTDWETPGQWYDFPAPFVASFGNDIAGLKADGLAVVPHAVFTIRRHGGGTNINRGDRISLGTARGFYVVAENGGGNFVGADRPWEGAWERFELGNLTRTTLAHGDVITLRASNGLYVASELHRNGELEADRANVGAWEKFTIEKVGGTGAIRSGDTVAIKANNNGRYWLASNGGGGGWRYQARATRYNLPGGQDIMMLKLDAPVPSWVATPIPVLTRQPDEAGADATAFWAAQAVRMVGWGWVDDAGKAPRYRQTAWAVRALFPIARWADSDPSADRNFIGANDAGGAYTRFGDSGSPLLWTNAVGQTFTLGAHQGNENYVSTMGVGMSIDNDPNTPNVAVWAEQVLGIKDCTAVDHTRLAISSLGSVHTLRTGTVALMTFNTLVKAQRARAVVEHFDLDNLCYVDRSPAELTYALAAGVMPTGWGLVGENCRYFDASRLDVLPAGGLSALRDTASGITLQRFEDELDARHAMGLLRRDGARYQCFFDGAGLPAASAGSGARHTYYKR